MIGEKIYVPFMTRKKEASVRSLRGRISFHVLLLQLLTSKLGFFRLTFQRSPTQKLLEKSQKKGIARGVSEITTRNGCEIIP
jgi:hypothetical protein